MRSWSQLFLSGTRSAAQRAVDRCRSDPVAYRIPLEGSLADSSTPWWQPILCWFLVYSLQIILLLRIATSPQMIQDFLRAFAAVFHGLPCSDVEAAAHLSRALELLASEGVKLPDAVHAVGGGQRRVVPAPLVRDQVDQHRARRLGRFHICTYGSPQGSDSGPGTRLKTARLCMLTPARTAAQERQDCSYTSDLSRARTTPAMTGSLGISRNARRCAKLGGKRRPDERNLIALELDTCWLTATSEERQCCCKPCMMVIDIRHSRHAGAND